MADYFENADLQWATIVGDSLIPSDETNQIFGNWTNNLYQNMQKVMNATNFFTFAPASLMTYYWTVVRRNLEWYYGFVYGIHNQGTLSSQIGSKICKMAANLTLSDGFYFEGTRKAEKFLEWFCKEHQTESKLKQKLAIHNAVGFTLAKVDCDKNGNLDLNFVQGNRYFAKTDDEKNVLSFYAVIKMLTDGVTENEEMAQGYYLVEQRYYKCGKPYQRYKVYPGPCIATAPIFNRMPHGERFEVLPRNVQTYILQRFGENILGKEILLPFDTIGAEIMLNTFNATGMDEYTCFADSTLANVQTQMYELDWTKTIKEENKYIAQDFVAMPETLTSRYPIAQTDEQREVALSMSGMAGFNKRLVKAVPLRDPEKSVPFVYHPEVLSDTYNNDINQILNEIAAGAQFSPITLAGFLRNGTDKTATEITADENATRLTIKNKRDLITAALNRLFAIILKHYGINDNCSMIFREGSLSNPKLELDLIISKYQAGLISHKTAVMRANPQFTKREAEEEYKQIETEVKQEAFGAADLVGEDDVNGVYQ